MLQGASLPSQKEAHSGKDRLWGALGDVVQQGSRVREGVVQDDGVPDPDVLQGPPAAVADGLVDGLQHLQPFAHLHRHALPCSAL